MTELLVGGVGIMLAALLGGATGFGFGLVATPSLLAVGIPLHQVVAVNLTLALLTRLLPAWQLRRHLVWPRAGGLIAGAVPGILLGLAVRGAIDTDVLKVFTGLLAIAAALVLTLRSRPTLTEPPAGRARPDEGTDPAAHEGSSRPAVVMAGVGGGFLGVTTSLNGVPPALLLTRDRVEPLPFIADMTIYFVAANVLTLGLLAAGDPATITSVGRYVLAWLPLGVLGNQIGVRSARLLPYGAFRGTALAVIFLSGCATIVGAL